MGQTVSEMAGKFRSFIANMDSIAMSVIEGSDDLLVQYVQQQLMKGLDADGNPLRPYRDPDYAEFKRSLNPLGVTDLRLYGSFYEYMHVKILTERAFTVISNDPKYQKLMKKYGFRTMDLGSDSILIYREERFNPFFVRLCGAYTGAGTTEGN